MTWFPCIGLEIHCQLRTNTKLFCACSAAPTEQPNRNICPICLGHPGHLPRLNAEAVRQAVRTVIALGMKVAPEIRFDRKHYFYPDLGKNYQTTQFFQTVGSEGTIAVEVRGRTRTIRLREAHIEEDAAKLLHVLDESMVDYNRGGMPLLEIVTEPDFESGEEAEAFLRSLQLLLQTIGSCDANMELGQLRCDANVSVSLDRKKFGERTELKNLNSPKFIRLAIDYEIQRQIKSLEANIPIRRETRSWNENRDITEVLRSKEQAHDYRYFPESELAVVVLEPADIEQLRESLPELPEHRIARFGKNYGISRAYARELVSDPGAADFFEQAVTAGGDPEAVANWMLNQLREIHKTDNLDFRTTPLTAATLAELTNLLRDESIAVANARKALKLVMETGHSLAQVIEQHHLGLCSDRAAITAWIKEVLEKCPEQVAQFRAGTRKVFEFLFGQVQKISRGKAHPRLARILLQQTLQTREICLLAMGGAIAGQRTAEGVVVASNAPQAVAARLLASLPGSVFADGRTPGVSIDDEPVSSQLSENLTPLEWFALYERVQKILASEKYAGILILHGLDTLAYTAPMLRWLCPRPSVPIVFTGAVRCLDDPDSDAPGHVRGALTALGSELPPGIWVHFQGRTFPAFNLRMTGIGPGGFACPNVDLADKARERLGAGRWRPPEPTPERLTAVAAKVMLLKVHPGMSPAMFLPLIESGVSYVILELYDTGTANTRRDSSHSLLPLIQAINARDGLVFGTSQLGVRVDLDGYETSQDLWKAGVVPLGGLVTETAYVKLLATLLLETERNLIVRRMIAEEESL